MAETIAALSGATSRAAPEASAEAAAGAPLLEMRAITKTFPGVRALDGVSFDVRPGEIHALVGENGAGKSTLMKVLSGVYPHGTYEGDIVLDGAVQRFRSIRDSEGAGIAIIHQELALVPLLSIAENLFLGHERARAGVIDRRETREAAQALLARVGLRERPGTRVGALGMGKQQMVEIAKALGKDVRLLILDEPTSSLNDRDSEALLDLLLDLKGRGIASVLISHKLGEVSRVADRITVLRDGAVVSTMDAGSAGEAIAEDRIIRDMVGRSLTDRFPPREPRIGGVLMEVEDWTVEHPTDPDRLVVDGVSFHVRAGEVLGIAGLMGAGRTELAMSLFGRAHGTYRGGTVRMDGRRIDTSTVRRAVAAGLAYVTEDRKQYGLVLDEPIRRNVPLANLAGISSGGILDEGRELSVARGYRDRLNIRCSSVAQETVNLSGGNQQKVVLAKWLFADPRVLILDEPTRGIDVGAKYEIYAIINELAAGGRGVVVISSEMPELLGISDRIHVMNEGRFVAEMPTAEASQEAIMAAIVRDGSAAQRDGPAAQDGSAARAA